MEAWRQYHAFGRSVPAASHTRSEKSSAASSTPAVVAGANDVDAGAAVESQPETVADGDPSPIGSDTKALYVQFEENDSQNPQNWSIAYKAWVIFLLSNLTTSLTLAAAVGAPTEDQLRDRFGATAIQATATTGAFLVGQGLGAMPAAPLSECESTLSSAIPCFAQNSRARVCV
jgi:hypothetical protein